MLSGRGEIVLVELEMKAARGRRLDEVAAAR